MSSISPFNIFSLIALALALCLLWSIHTGSPDIMNGPDLHLWQQPLSISGEFPERISTAYWQFDFEAVEQVLTKIKLNGKGELILNQSTADILTTAVSKLPLDMTKADLQRVGVLVSKGGAGKSGQQLSNMLITFYYFQQASRIDETKNSEAKASDFEQSVLRQERYFGKHVAKQLFGRQNALTYYLHARRRINEDSSLNKIQKQERLRLLQDRFKENGQ